MPASAEIYYEDSGGDGPVVVFSHGIMMDHSMFDPQVAVLRDRYRCITWDQRGHGATESGGSFTYWDSAQDLLVLLDLKRVERATLVGMSQGGFVHLRAALLAPERVAGLVFIDSQAGPEDPDKVAIYDAFARTWAEEGPTTELAATVAGIILGEGPDPAPWIEKWMARDPASITEPYAALVEREDLHDRLAEIAAPALVIHGDQDIAIDVPTANALCEGLPGCEGVKVIEGAGHAANLARPDEVNAALEDFLQRHAS
jgi:pimeloyl-ACP methyl ester carboxylesterase